MRLTKPTVREAAFRLFGRVAAKLGPYREQLARVPGVSFVYHWLYQRVKPRGLVQLGVEGARFWIKADDAGLARLLMLNGEFERDETALLKQFLKPGMRVLDVGANIGYYSVLSSRLVGPSGQVFAFEPEPSNHELLARNLVANECTNVRAVRIALSDRQGTTTLFVDRTNYGNPSMCEANVPNKGEAVTIETTTLDRFIDENSAGPIDFMKIDVQGAEGLVFAGAKRLLQQPSLNILLEVWPAGLRNLGTEADSLLDMLVSYGFRIRCLGSKGPVDAGLTASDVVRSASRSRDGFLNLFLTK